MKHLISKFHIITVLTALTILPLSSCGRHTTGSTTQSIIVSVEPLRTIVSAVAGPQWEVSSIVESGADPENFDPPVSTLRKAAASKALFTTGFLPFEKTVINRIGGDNTQVFDISDGIELIEGTHGDDIVDPHIWASLRNAQVIARNTGNALASLDPEHSSEYAHRADSVVDVYSRADIRMDSLLRRVPNRAFLIRHPALTYFARDYLLEQVAVGADNKDLTVGALRNAIEEAGAVGAIAYFVESPAERDRAAGITSELGVPVIIFNPLNPDIIGQLNEVAGAISAESARPL